jgi:hypothetical protein
MSNDLRVYDPDTEWFEDAEPLQVTAVSGEPRLDLREDDPDERKGHGRSVQLSIGRGMNRQFTIMTEAQVLDLIGILSKRLACADNYSATAPLDELRVQPDGTKQVVEEW